MYYTYTLVDPETSIPFYVGKGKGRRYKRHLKKSHNVNVRSRVNKLSAIGLFPKVELEYFNSESDALSREVQLISSIGRADLNSGPLLNLDSGGLFSGPKKGRPAPNKGIPCSEKFKIEQAARLAGRNAGIPVAKVTCLSCKKTGGLPVMSRYHLNNCHRKAA